MTTFRQPIVNFSLRKEIFFVTVGSIAGAFTMHTPRAIFDLLGNTPYLITLLVAARVVNSDLPEVGFLLHLCVATIIGIVTGVFLHKVFKYNISRFTNGIVYGAISGVTVFTVFAIPVSQLVLAPNQIQVLSELDPQMRLDAEQLTESNIARGLLDSFLIHIIWGVTVGIIGSSLTRKFGAHYRCYRCDIEFSNIQTYNRHTKYVHENPSHLMKKILILGGGYAGVNVLNIIQKHFENDINVEINLVSESNFFLHTPMLPEMATGTIEARHIATPIRRFCKRARFFQAKVMRVDLKEKKVTIQRMSDKKRANAVL